MPFFNKFNVEALVVIMDLKFHGGVINVSQIKAVHMFIPFHSSKGNCGLWTFSMVIQRT